MSSRRRRVLPAALIAAAATLAWPTAAMAHGLTARADLPLPRWLFGWGAAVVLVISFLALAVLWPKPKLENARSRVIPWLRFLTSRAVEIVCGAIGVAILVLVIYAGFAGEQSPSSNIAPVIVFVTFWVGFVPVSVLFGNVYAAFNPWRAIGRVAFRTARRPYPAGLGRWPASIVLIGFTTFELAVRQASAPEKVAVVALGYTVVTLVAMAIYGVDVWVERGEGFAVYFDLFSRMAVFGREGDDIVLRAPLSALPRLAPLPGHDDGRGGDDRQPHVRRHGRGELLPGHRAGVPRRSPARSGANDVWQAQIAAFLGLIGCDRSWCWPCTATGCFGASLIDPSMTPGLGRERVRSLAGADRVRVRLGALLHVPRLPGPDDHPARVGPARARLRPVRDGRRTIDYGMIGAAASGTSRSSWSSSATRWPSPSPTTARWCSTRRSATRCARSSGCWA